MVDSSSSGKMTPPIKSLESSAVEGAEGAATSETTFLLELEAFLLAEEEEELEAALRLLLLLFALAIF